ncbi:hypothetical protein N7516_000252 [Penicillium verrucosum]|uniref:uncharacterized protein n=1 Tax=Penicillium verrucosum TaxID=60171 RepID=UPI0025459FB7|nr:uncharacterized protein N7516_000252 [Penicillium verrucosum]KAJ5940084.1 hypothetical protein N7516_000252 [Penicillium verrucosum]
MDDTTQQIRERIVRQIQVIFSESLPDVGSGTMRMRIIGDIPNNYFKSIRPFVSETEEYLQRSHPDNKTRLVAVKICRGKHSYFIIDLNNTDYNYKTAHECRTLIPVYVLGLTKRQLIVVRKRSLDETIAKVLRNMHNLHGQDPLPLFDNHYDENLQYPNPRNLHIEI